MQHYDVIIVGGGPAGSSCAWALQSSGLKVLILDKSPFPRDKVCAGWITPQVPQLLGLDLDDYQQRHTLQPFRGFRTGMLGKALLTTDYGDTVSYGILRREFDTYLLERSGADLQLGESVSTLTHSQDQWWVNTAYTAPMLVGAGGHFCPVAKHLNPKAGTAKQEQSETVFAQEMEFKLSPQQLSHCSIPAHMPELYFLPELDGYGWCVRKGSYLNIGLGRTDNHQLAKYVARFRTFLLQQGKLPQDIPERFRGHAYRLASLRKHRRLLHDGAMLIGDAAGLAYPQSGEGIYCAIKSGLLAAETIRQAQGHYTSQNLSPYLEQLDAFLGKAESIDTFPLPYPLRRFIASALLQSAFFSRHVLLDKWFLHQHTSKLANPG